MATDPDWRKRKRNQRSDKVIFSDDTQRQIEEMASIGLTRVEICKVLGINVRTLQRREKDDPGLAVRLDAAKERANATVRFAAFRMASSGTCWPATIGWLERRDPDNWVDPGKNVNVNVHPALRSETGELLKGRQLVDKLRKELADYEASLPKEIEVEAAIDAEFEPDET